VADVLRQDQPAGLAPQPQLANLPALDDAARRAGAEIDLSLAAELGNHSGRGGALNLIPGEMPGKLTKRFDKPGRQHASFHHGCSLTRYVVN
jgi:hypothetical protein